MNRMTRFAAAGLLVAALLFAAVPTAQALPLGKPQHSLAAGGSWLDAALIWLSQFLTAPEQPVNVREKAVKAPTDATSTNANGGGGFTGSCIDPNGCIVVDRGNGGNK